MIRKKVTLLGGSGVGKTSLCSKFVHNVFSDIYRTTIGVQIESKQLVVGDEILEMILWDFEGEDGFAQLQLNYLQGASGYLLVVDGTRAATLDTALNIDSRVRGAIGPKPCALLINKLDLFEKWEVSPSDVRRLISTGYTVHLCSAKSGSGVDEAFRVLASRLLVSSTTLHDSLFRR